MTAAPLVGLVLAAADPPPRVVVGDRCTACGACLATCPEGALRRAPRRPLLSAGRCTGCLECVEVCPAGAIAPVPATGTWSAWAP